ncbi:hypothetical protein GCK72_024870 [Caenorhabditis remanei]|uniref:Ig-like domain-containing protein n=1 Tax=Caenorhabditis remanei TaxID=31234 RepID=A0A6A5G0S1_CAERE|nr:hypothetical protein GCK72_024870 [Caenorhabditis remanei]KAF1748403.1 hypothetical protein GCK72_024870 [Caenorhabditis remanei]
MLVLAFVLINCALSFGHPPVQIHNSVLNMAKDLDQQQLTSKPMLKVTAALEDTQVPAGAPHTLYCEVLATPAASIRWLFNGKKVQGNMELNIEEKLLNTKKNVVDSGIIGSTYTIECPSSETSGTYTCVAFNGHQTVETSAVIETEGDFECRQNRRSAPKVVQWTDSRFEMQGNVATLSCRANQAADWAWTYEGDLITDESRFEVVPNGDLRIKNIVWADMGTYECIARNDYGETRQDTFLYPTAKKSA